MANTNNEVTHDGKVFRLQEVKYDYEMAPCAQCELFDNTEGNKGCMAVVLSNFDCFGSTGEPDTYLAWKEVKSSH